MASQEGNLGPIPGENFTSDTKNYPWHQPPEFTDINKALDMMSKKLTDFKRANGILTIVEMGVPLTRVTDMLVTAGIGEGKWTPDFAMLLAGPICRMIELICIGFEVEYKIGIEEDEDDFVTAAFFTEQKKLHEESTGLEILKSEIGQIKKEASNQEAGGSSAPEGDIQESGMAAMNSGGGAASEVSAEGTGEASQGATGEAPQ
jgi:hypothetical protein